MARAIRFIHTADTHLGTAFLGMRLTNSARSDLLRSAINDAFAAVIDHAIEREVDFVCFAGDIYNSETKNLEAQALFRNGMLRLEQAGIRAFVVGGNHDPIGAVARLPLPSNVHVFDTENVEQVLFESGGEAGVQSCALYGRSYKIPEENTNFAAGFKRKDTADNAIGILHTNVGSSSTPERYARCEIADLEAAGMDYWALGHIHLPQVLKDNKPMIVYPGSTQALQINETGDHGCELITLDYGHASRERLSTGQVGFYHVEVEISSCTSVPELAGAVNDSIVAAIGEPRESARIVRVILNGKRHFGLTEILREPEEFIAAVDMLLHGELPSTYLDAKIIDRTIGDLSGEMHEHTNAFLRSILDETYDDAAALLQEIVQEDKVLKAIQKIDSSLLSEYTENPASVLETAEYLIPQAKEELYRMLTGRSEV